MNRQILEKIKIDFFGWLSQGATQWCLITSPFLWIALRFIKWKEKKLATTKKCWRNLASDITTVIIQFKTHAIIQQKQFCRWLTKKLAWSSNLISDFFPLYLSLQQQQCLCMAEGARTHDDNTAPEGQGIWRKTHNQACPPPLSRISYSRYWHVADHNQRGCCAVAYWTWMPLCVQLCFWLLCCYMHDVIVLVIVLITLTLDDLE